MAKKRAGPQPPLEPEDESQEVPDVEDMREMPLPPAPKHRPVHTIRFGRIQAAIWANWNSELGVTIYNVTFSRSYRDAEQQWQYAHSFGVSDLLLVAKLADLAHTWISEQMQSEGV